MHKTLCFIIDWRSSSINRQILTAAVIVAAMTAAVSIFSALKELVVAYYFGTSSDIDAFLIAFMLPSFMVNVLASALIPAVMPVYIEVKEKKSLKDANQLFVSSMVVGLVFLIFITLLMVFSAKYILPILGSGFDKNTLQLCLNLFYMLLPLIVINGMIKFYSTILNAEKKFAAAGLVPVFLPICVMLFLLVLHKKWGVYTLAAGSVCGMAMGACILAILLYRQNLPIMPRWNGLNKELKAVIRQYLPMVSGAVLMCSTILIDNSMAAMLAPGSVASLNYGNKLIATISALGTTALGTAVLPHFSTMVAKADWNGAKHTLKTYSKIILFLSVPVTMVLIFFSREIIAVIFQRGSFSLQDTLVVAKIQSFYALQIPVYALGILGVRLLSAMQMNHILMKISAMNLIVNIVGNYLFMKFLGVAGIALSTSVVYFFSCIAILACVKSRLSQ